METIINFLYAIGNWISFAFDFLISTVEGVAYLAETLLYFFGRIPDYFAWLPDEYVALIVIVISSGITFKIIGREG